MKKTIITFRMAEDHSFTFRTMVNNRLIYYTVFVRHDPEEVGTWDCRVFHLHFLALGRVQTLELHHHERIYHPPKGRPSVVARQVLMHYLRSFECDDLPF